MSLDRVSQKRGDGMKQDLLIAAEQDCLGFQPLPTRLSQKKKKKKSVFVMAWAQRTSIHSEL